MGEYGKPAILGGSPVRSRPLGRWPIVTEEEVEAVSRVVRSGRMFASMYEGDEVPKFEDEFSRAMGVERTVAVSSGTAALDVVLRALGVGPGDEVITTPYTFIATATCILHNHAIPVFADVDHRTRNIDPEEVKRKITDKTKAVIVVHLGGVPADMDAVMEVAEERGIFVVEDCAQAHLAEYKGRKVGGIGHAGIFSFQQSKNMTAGEGGAITTNDEELAERCASLREHGRRRDKPWYYHEELGWNYRMTELQAAILRVQLRRLPSITEERRRNSAYLDRVLSEFDFLEPSYIPPYTKSAYHLYLVDYIPEKLGLTKGQLSEALSAEGIPLTPGYAWPVYENPIFSDPDKMPECPFKILGVKREYGRGLCPVAEKLCYETGMWFPGYILNAPTEELDDVGSALRKVEKYREELLERLGPTK